MKDGIEVRPLGGYRLYLRFEDDEAGEIDLSAFLRFEGVFEPLQDPARYAEFRSEVRQLDELDWEAIASTDFRREEVKEAKQAEFLVFGGFPWERVRRIGVCSAEIRE